MTLLADAHGELVALDHRVTDLGIAATLLDDDAIAALDRERRDWRPTCPGCHQELVLKRYPNRPDRFLFAHKPGEAENCAGASAGESAAHHELKLRVADLGKRAGWTPRLEVYGEDNRCRADVLLTKGKEHRPWEVQLSDLATPDAIARTSILDRSFGQPVWLHTSEPMWAHQVPALKLDRERRNVVDGIYDRTGEERRESMSLGRVVSGVLHKQLRYVYDEHRGGGFGYWFAPNAKSHAPQARPRVMGDTDAVGGQVLCKSVKAAELKAFAQSDPYVVNQVIAETCVPLSEPVTCACGRLAWSLYPDRCWICAGGR